jgi:TRAP-type C4-dicarboxylate transport system substrate-binding protein
LTIAAMLIAAACALQAQEKIQLKIASVAPSRSPWDIQQRELAQEWSQITDGLVSVTFFDSNSLGGEKGVIQKLRSSRPGQKPPLDGAILTTTGLNELNPDVMIFTLSVPFLITSQKELDATLDKFGPDFIAKYRKSGFEMIAWSNVGWLSFYTKDPFTSLQELKKIKIAAAGLDSPTIENVFHTSGFTTEAVVGSKLLQSLKSSNGVHGFYGVHMFAYVTGFSKTVNYALDAKLCPVLAGFVMASETWAKIPEKYRAKMLDAASRMEVRLNAALEASDRDYVARMKAEGVNIVTLSPAELTSWQAEFSKDVDKVTKSVPGAFDLTLYRNIQSYLKSVK